MEFSRWHKDVALNPCGLPAFLTLTTRRTVMKSNATWLIGAAALALAACSDGGPDEADIDASGEIGSEIATNAAETEATSSSADTPEADPTSAATPVEASGDVQLDR